jgi:hypothetical protein
MIALYLVQLDTIKQINSNAAPNPQNNGHISCMLAGTNYHHIATRRCRTITVARHDKVERTQARNYTSLNLLVFKIHAHLFNFSRKYLAFY